MKRILIWGALLCGITLVIVAGFYIHPRSTGQAADTNLPSFGDVPSASAVSPSDVSSGDVGTPTANAPATLKSLPAGITKQLTPFLKAYFTQLNGDTEGSIQDRTEKVMTKASFQAATDPQNPTALDFSPDDSVDTVTPKIVPNSMKGYVADGEVQVTAWVDLVAASAGSQSETEPTTTLSSWKLQSGQYVLVGFTYASRTQ